MSIGIKIKPISVNDCWQGRRFKTDKYKDYEKELLIMLPNIDVPEGKIELDIEFGFSSRASDIDNPLKPFIDILQKKYEFNDKNIFQLNVKKKICRKGAEYVIFSIREIS